MPVDWKQGREFTLNRNAAFAAGKPDYSDLTPERQVQLVEEGQAPPAALYLDTLLGSFQKYGFGGLGNFFVQSNVGNCMTRHKWQSGRYAVEHLGTRYLAVIGDMSMELMSHAVLWYKTGLTPKGLEPLMKHLFPSLEATVRDDPKEWAKHATLAHVRRNMRIAQKKVVDSLIRKGEKEVDPDKRAKALKKGECVIEGFLLDKHSGLLVPVTPGTGIDVFDQEMPERIIPSQERPPLFDANGELIHGLMLDVGAKILIWKKCADSRSPDDVAGLDPEDSSIYVFSSASGHITETDMAGVAFLEYKHNSGMLHVTVGHDHCGGVTAGVNAEEKNSIEEGYDRIVQGIIHSVVENAPDTSSKITETSKAHAIDMMNKERNALAEIDPPGNVTTAALYHRIESGKLDVLIGPKDPIPSKTPSRQRGVPHEHDSSCSCGAYHPPTLGEKQRR